MDLVQRCWDLSKKLSVLKVTIVVVAALKALKKVATQAQLETKQEQGLWSQQQPNLKILQNVIEVRTQHPKEVILSTMITK